jgi:hypothetical protein
MGAARASAERLSRVVLRPPYGLAMTDSSAPADGIEPRDRQVANARMGVVPAERAAADAEPADGAATA